MNKEETKDEILSKYEYDVHYYGGGRRHILEAMDEYAKQEAIEFARWIQLNFHEFDLGVYVSLLENNIDKPKKKFNLEQLYNLYSQQDKQ